MASIKFDGVSLEYPLYGENNRSLKKSLINISTGGVFARNSKDNLVVTALNEVSFELRDGDSVGLIGHNGAGKTTLLRTMAGLYVPTSGSVKISGSVSTIIELGAGLDATLSGYDNIVRLGLLHGISLSDINKSMGEIEEFTELGNFLFSPVSTYSSGMLMRLMFAVSTIKMPDILIVDEMFSTGDSAFQIKAEKRMKNLIKQSKIFIFASHSRDLINQYCDRIFELNHGTLTEL